MPNWCHNTIIVPRRMVEKIVNSKGEVDFSLALPIPEELKNTVAPTTGISEQESKRLKSLYGSDNWYDWSVRNWGTKWNAKDTDIDASDSSDEIIITFSTPWSHPEQWIRFISHRYPLSIIHVEWEEEQGFGASYTIQDGEQTRPHEWDLPEWEVVMTNDAIGCDIVECLKSGGNDGGYDKFERGYFYIDYDSTYKYSSIKDAIKAVEEVPVDCMT